MEVYSSGGTPETSLKRKSPCLLKVPATNLEWSVSFFPLLLFYVFGSSFRVHLGKLRRFLTYGSCWRECSKRKEVEAASLLGPGPRHWQSVSYARFSL